jgi:hypothetical protein
MVSFIRFRHRRKVDLPQPLGPNTRKIREIAQDGFEATLRMTARQLITQRATSSDVPHHEHEVKPLAGQGKRGRPPKPGSGAGDKAGAGIRCRRESGHQEGRGSARLPCKGREISPTQAESAKGKTITAHDPAQRQIRAN